MAIAVPMGEGMPLMPTNVEDMIDHIDKALEILLITDSPALYQHLTGRNDWLETPFGDLVSLEKAKLELELLRNSVPNDVRDSLIDDQEVAQFLLKRDPEKYSWARKYLVRKSTD